MAEPLTMPQAVGSLQLQEAMNKQAQGAQSMWTCRCHATAAGRQPGSCRDLRTSAMNIWSRHFLKLRISVQTCSSVCRLAGQCSAGMMRQWPGTRRPLQRVQRTTPAALNGRPQLFASKVPSDMPQSRLHTTAGPSHHSWGVGLESCNGPMRCIGLAEWPELRHGLVLQSAQKHGMSALPSPSLRAA